MKKQLKNLTPTATLLCNALFRVGNFELEDAQTKLTALQIKLMQSRRPFNDDLEQRILRQENYVNQLLNKNYGKPKYKKHY